MEVGPGDGEEGAGVIDYDPALACVPRKKRKGLSPELALQISAFTYYDKRCRLDKTLREKTRLFAINPIPGKTMQQAVLSKRAGLRAGIWDAVLLDRRGWELRTVWLEFKADNGKLTPAQKDWFDWLKGTSVQFHEVRTLSEFEAVIG